MKIRIFVSAAKQDLSVRKQIISAIKGNSSEDEVSFTGPSEMKVISEENGSIKEDRMDFDNANVFMSIISCSYLDDRSGVFTELERACERHANGDEPTVLVNVVIDEEGDKWLQEDSSDRVKLFGPGRGAAVKLYSDGQYTGLDDKSPETVQNIRGLIKQIEKSLGEAQETRKRIEDAAQVVLLNDPIASSNPGLDIHTQAYQDLKRELGSYSIPVEEWQAGWANVKSTSGEWPVQDMVAQLRRPALFVKLLTDSGLADLAASDRYECPTLSRLSKLGDELCERHKPSALRTAQWLLDPQISPEFAAAAVGTRHPAPAILRLVGSPETVATTLRRELRRNVDDPPPIILVQEGAEGDPIRWIEVLIEAIAPTPPNPMDYVALAEVDVAKVLRLRGPTDAIVILHDLSVTFGSNEEAKSDKSRREAFMRWCEREIPQVEICIENGRSLVRRDPFRLLLTNRFTQFVGDQSRLGAKKPFDRWNLLRTTGDGFEPDEKCVVYITERLKSWFGLTPVATGVP